MMMLTIVGCGEEVSSDVLDVCDGLMVIESRLRVVIH